MEMRFLRRVDGLKVSFKRSRLRWSGLLIRVFTGHIQPEGDAEPDPEFACGITFLFWPVNTSDPLHEELESVPG